VQLAIWIFLYGFLEKKYFDEMTAAHLLLGGMQIVAPDPPGGSQGKLHRRSPKVVCIVKEK
jgi:hypothetical protein